MISVASILAALVTLFISLILPLIVYVVYGVKNKGKGVWSAWLLGAAGFFVFQMLIRLPILNALSLIPGYFSFVTEHYLWYSFLTAFTAALFETAGRYAVAKIMDKSLTVQRSIAAGLGHGGIEAIFIVGMTYINNLVYMVMIQTGLFDSLVEQTAGMGLDVTQLEGIKATMISTSPIIFVLAGYERILTMILHLALTMLVCYYVSRKKDGIGIAICLLLHWATDFIVPMATALSTDYMGEVVSEAASYVIAYSILTGIAVMSVMIIRRLKKNWNEEQAWN